MQNKLIMYSAVSEWNESVVNVVQQNKEEKSCRMQRESEVNCCKSSEKAQALLNNEIT